MKKFRLLVRTIHGHRVSSQLSLIDAASAAAIYKHLCKPVEVIPDTRQLRELHGNMDKEAAAFAEDQVKKQAMDPLTSGALLWDRQFCWKTLLDPPARVEPTSSPQVTATPPQAALSPESSWLAAMGRGIVCVLVCVLLALAAVFIAVGYILGLVLFASFHPVLAAGYFFGRFWRWLIREQPPAPCSVAFDVFDEPVKGGGPC